MITQAQLITIMPYAGKARTGAYVAPLNAAALEWGINTPARLGMWLANLAHESGHLRYTLEIGDGVAYNGRKDLGNTRDDAWRIAGEHGSTPGPWWRGRGLAQITGYDNYLSCSRDAYSDPNLLLHHPELLEQPLDAARSAAWFWWRAKLWKWADVGDFDGVCDVWNRGRKTARVGDALGYDDRASAWVRAQRVFGLTDSRTKL